MCCLRKNPCEGFTAKEQGALKQGQDGQGVLQAAKHGNIHLGMAQPAEEPALHLPHTSGGEKNNQNPSPKLQLLSTKTPPIRGVHGGRAT